MDTLTRKILLNPGPPTTSGSVKESLLVNDICPREEEFGRLFMEITDGLKVIGNTGDDYNVCLFAASGTGAVEAMLTSAVGEGDKALVITNGAYGYRMADICSSYGIDHHTLCEYGEYPEVSAVRGELERGDYTHLAMVHHETSTGMMNPLKSISGLCGEYGIELIVDAMSSFGGYPVDLENSGISYLAASSNKCIHGMAGLSFVLFHSRCIPAIKENRKNFYFDLYRQWSHQEEKQQMRFTPPVQVCYAFRRAIDETLRETVRGRWKRYRENWQVLYEGISDMGFRFFLPMEQQSKILMAIHMDERLSRGFDHFHDYLHERDITVYPGVIPETKTFRMAVIGDLYKKDLKYVVNTMKEYVRSVA